MVIDCIIESTLILQVEDLQKISQACWVTTKQLFTYKNPKFLENEKWGYSNYSTPRFLYSFQIIEDQIYISRGGLDKLENHLKKFKVSLNKIDRTFVGKTINFNQSNITLRPEQTKWVEELCSFDNGCGQAYTSFGKTVSSSIVIQKIGQCTTILVHTSFLQKQWIQELMNPNLFNLSIEDIGGVGGVFGTKKDFVEVFGKDAKYKRRLLGKVNICLYQSVCKKEHLDFFEEHTGLLIFDEGQKTPIEGVQKIVNNFRCRYKYAVSAGFKRKDGKEFMTFDAFGPVRTIAVEKASKSKILSKIYLVKTPYKDDDYAFEGNYSNMITRMAKDKQRNIFICKRAIAKVRKGKLVMIFVERKEHAGILYHMLSNFRIDMLIGGVDKKKIKEDKSLSPSAKKVLLNYDHVTAYDRIKSLADRKKLQIIIGTQKAEVGLSIRTLDHGIITTPVGNNLERFNQIIGRFERTYSADQEKYFEGPKPTPTIEVLVDNMNVSRNASSSINDFYGDRVIKIRKKKNTIIRKKGDRNE
jgi:superfamily II DNA or RNA helicase